MWGQLQSVSQSGHISHPYIVDNMIMSSSNSFKKQSCFIWNCQWDFLVKWYDHEFDTYLHHFEFLISIEMYLKSSDSLDHLIDDVIWIVTPMDHKQRNCSRKDLLVLVHSSLAHALTSTHIYIYIYMNFFYSFVQCIWGNSSNRFCDSAIYYWMKE